MLQEAYDKKKLSSIGIGVGVVTFLSLASMSSNMCNNSITMGTNGEYIYEGISYVNDNEGDMCISSEMSNMFRGDVVKNSDIIDFVHRREKKIIEIHVTRVSKHISTFDFEDEYEEI